MEMKPGSTTQKSSRKSGVPSRRGPPSSFGRKSRLGREWRPFSGIRKVFSARTICQEEGPSMLTIMSKFWPPCASTSKTADEDVLVMDFFSSTTTHPVTRPAK
ncbi:unnamed protein product [Orchesella dallaii]|uniref:Uncharacterized protein n=1 Tax=Orchesella dallaii TaxID=48710 RepID=A0ABP1QPP2_9HEXA